MNTKTMAASLVSVLAFGCVCTGAWAQGPGGRGMAPVKNEKAWELEGKIIAQSLGLSDELTTKLVDAYKAARDSHTAAVSAKLAEQQGGRPDFRALAEVNQAEKAKLETALKGFLNEEQAAKALATLGAFSRRWDPMVMTLDGMGLDEKTKTDAMNLVAAHVAEADKTMQGAREGGDFGAVRAVAQQQREKLDADLAKILSAEQMVKWKEATAMRGPGRQRGGRPANAPTPEAKPNAK